MTSTLVITLTGSDLSVQQVRLAHGAEIEAIASYRRATSFGAVMEPDLLVACIVGNGEAETCPIAKAWHSYKYLELAELGAVLPLLHLNGYKISSPPIYGTMNDEQEHFTFGGASAAT